MVIKNKTVPRTVVSVQPFFTFHEFKFNTINLPNLFNNSYKDLEDYNQKLTKFIQFALPTFSGESIKTLDSDLMKKNTYHFHRIKENKYDILEKIFNAYGFPEKRIEDLLLGDKIYQFILAQNNSPRIIVERLDNIFSVLFLDVNHHIYMNSTLVDKAGSLFFEICPIYENKNCVYMDNFCMAFDYLDKEKLKESFGNSFT